MESKKSFGLIIPKKTKTFNPQKSRIFGSDSDDDTAPKRKMPKIPQSKPISSKIAKVEELVDPSIYEYDSIYDDMKAQKAAEVAPKEKKSARYIDSLLKAADKRKKEHERRLEKKVQIEREKEGDKFKDKEMFVTSAYKKKIQEREEEEERERRENELNDMMDVTKQKDLSGFYRHFLKQSVGEEKVPVFGERLKIKEEPLDDEPPQGTISKADTDAPSFPDDKDDSDMEKSSDEDQNTFNSYEKSQRIRKYRKRTNSERSEEQSDEDAEHHTKKSDKKSFKESLNKRSHFVQKKTNLSKSTSKEDDEKALKQQNSSEKTQENVTKSAEKRVKYCKEDEERSDDSEQEKDLVPKAPRKRNDSDSSSASINKDKDLVPKAPRKRNDSDSSSASNSSSDDQKIDGESLDNKAVENGVKSDDKDKEKSSKPRRNIYEKRTVGDVFAEAQARYFQRLAARGS